MSKVRQIFATGAKVVAPLLMTLLLLYWVFIGLEGLFRSLLLYFIEPSSYFTGLGWIMAAFITFFIGLLVQIPVLQNAIHRLLDQLLKLPLIHTLYQTATDITGFFTKKGVKKGKIVKLKTPVGNMLGIMTQDHLDELPKGIGGKKEVAVYVSMSYQIGGFTFLVPEDSVEPVDISVQKGLALTMSAYISGNEKGQ